MPRGINRRLVTSPELLELRLLTPFFVFCVFFLTYLILCFLKGYEPIPDFWDGKSRECLHWVHIVSTFISQSARKIGNCH